MLRGSWGVGRYHFQVAPVKAVFDLYYDRARAARTPQRGLVLFGARPA